MNDALLANIVNGVDDSLSTAAKNRLKSSIDSVASKLEAVRMNNSSAKMSTDRTNPNYKRVVGGTMADAEIYTNISELINGNIADVGGFGTLLESLYAKNKKGYAILKDYELMPILIPQINRVLMFLVNECLSPDIQNDTTFTIKYLDSENDPDRVQADIDQIKKEMLLDNMLRDVYMNRYKLGREYYAVIDYNKTFDHMTEMLRKKGLLESTQQMPDVQFFDSVYGALTTTLDEVACSINITAIQESAQAYNGLIPSDENRPDIVETSINLDFKGMNIIIERSSIAEHVKKAHGELLAESYSKYSMENLMQSLDGSSTQTSLNEAVVDTSKLSTLVDTLKKKKLQRCTIERFDPAKIFKLKIGGKVIGYFHTTDINEGSANLVNFAQALKDQLLKSRATNLNAATANAEDIISKALAEKIVNKFDPNIGINRLEDIDLLHDYIKNNEIYKGNKRITFYYSDEIFDLSRADDSILINGVFFTKLYATLLLNNIMTKVLRGRGRQIHTIRMGASPNVQRYIQNAMAALTMPENNLGTLHGSFEQILNPFNAASDIVIPTEDDTDRYITTDYIPGQDVNMDEDFLRMLLNSIVSTFGLDSAVIDATNGNLQFARTLSMESLQICNAVRNEQQDLHDNWEAMCLRVLSIMGTDATKSAVDQGMVKVQFYEPKTLILQNMIDDLNNVKSFADALADIIPAFNLDGTEKLRTKFIYRIVKEKSNQDWQFIEELLRSVRVDINADELEELIQKVIQEYKENVEQHQLGDANQDGVVDQDDRLHSEYGEYSDMAAGGEEGELTPEEEELMGSPDEEL